MRRVPALERSSGLKVAASRLSWLMKSSTSKVINGVFLRFFMRSTQKSVNAHNENNLSLDVVYLIIFYHIFHINLEPYIRKL